METPSSQIPRRFVNEKDRVVQDAIDGLIATHSAYLTRLDGYPHTKVVLRRDWDKATTGQEKVALVTGGGAGHEPAHAGFVGKGLLTAAVSGEIFASPTVEAVLAAILAVTGTKGCLVIVKNYTGDSLNFGLAVEKAKHEFGLDVKMVICADDVAIDTDMPRGVAGTLFVHKVAGAAAEAGASLDQVAAEAENVCNSVKTMGVSLTTCSQPFQEVEGIAERSLGDNVMEIGLGIHGEPGVRKAELQRVEAVASIVVDALLKHVPLVDDVTGQAHQSGVVVMINNLGSVPIMEMSIIAKEVLKNLAMGGTGKGANSAKVYMVGPAHLMTALDMKGFSVSLLRLDGKSDRISDPLAPSRSPMKGMFASCGPSDAELAAATAGSGAGLLQRLLAPVASHTAWPQLSPEPSDFFAAMSSLVPSPLSLVEEKLVAVAERDDNVESLIRAACEALVGASISLNKLDKLVGDGDTGTQMSLGAKAILSALDGHTVPSADRSELCLSLGRVLSRHMGGSSGVLLSIMFSRMGGSYKETTAMAAEGLGQFERDQMAFEAGLQGITEYGGASLGDRTMLDALIPASTPSVPMVFPAVMPTLQQRAQAAEEGAQNTAAMEHSKAGRSSYLSSSSLKGHEDPGARAVAIVLKAMSHGVLSSNI